MQSGPRLLAVTLAYGTPMQPLVVDVRTPGDVHLAVSSTAPARFVVRSGPETRLRGVFVAGKAEASSASATPIDVVQLSGAFGRLPDTSARHETSDTLTRAAITAGAPLAMLVVADLCDELILTEPTAPAASPAVLTDDEWRTLERELSALGAAPARCAAKCPSDARPTPREIAEAMTDADASSLRARASPCRSCMEMGAP
jgi:hypothetical protein